MPPNEQSFVQAWDLKNVCPEPLLIENMTLKLTTKSQIVIRLAPNRSTTELMLLIVLPSSHTCTKPSVILNLR
jgi:hypothetical protein